jgi:hypothetical protein
VEHSTGNITRVLPSSIVYFGRQFSVGGHNVCEALIERVLAKQLVKSIPTVLAQVIHQLGHRQANASLPKKRDEDCVTECGLRFGPEVPVKTITLDAPELSGPDADQYEVIGYKTSHRLARHYSAYEVLRFQRPVLKRKDSGVVTTTPAAFNVLDNSIADVS